MKKKSEIELETGIGNEERAGWAEAALVAFAEAKGEIMPEPEDQEDYEDEICDLICDLLHLAKLRITRSWFERGKSDRAINIDTLLSRAKDHFDYETKGETK